MSQRMGLPQHLLLAAALGMPRLGQMTATDVLCSPLAIHASLGGTPYRIISSGGSAAVHHRGRSGVPAARREKRRRRNLKLHPRCRQRRKAW